MDIKEAKKYGRFGDSLLAHISPEEAMLLKRLGGSGTLNPKTGLPEFFGFGSIFKAISKPFTAVGSALGTVANTLIGTPVKAITSPIFGSDVGSALGTAASIAGPLAASYFAAPYISSMFGPATDLGMDLGVKVAGAAQGAESTIPLSAGGLSQYLAPEAIGLPQAGVTALPLPAGELGGTFTGGLTASEAAKMGAAGLSGLGSSGTEAATALGALQGTPSMTAALGGPLDLSSTLPTASQIWESALTSAASPYGYSPMYSMANLGGGGGWWGDLTDWYRNLSGLGKVAVPVAGVGLGANLLGGFMRYGQQQAQNEAVNRMLGEYLSAAQWTPEKRAGMLAGVGGQTAEAIKAGQERAAATAAASGRGGGYYGRESERLRRAGLETAASALAGTWGPANISPAAYEAMGRAQAGAISPLYETTQGLGGLAGTALPLMALYSMFGGGK